MLSRLPNELFAHALEFLALADVATVSETCSSHRYILYSTIRESLRYPRPLKFTAKNKLTHGSRKEAYRYFSFLIRRKFVDADKHILANSDLPFPIFAYSIHGDLTRNLEVTLQLFDHSYALTTLYSMISRNKTHDQIFDSAIGFSKLLERDITQVVNGIMNQRITRDHVRKAFREQTLKLSSFTAVPL